MKKRIMKIIKFILGSIILTPMAEFVISKITATSISTSGFAWLVYVISYILFPKIIPEDCKTSKLYNVALFVTFYFAICFILLALFLIY